MDRVGGLVHGRYELLELAGEGGMARVYRAVTRGAAGFRRPVALKRIREHLLENREYVEMFVEEARVCAELDHGNIVQVHDFGVDALGFFMVLEWVDGVHIGQYVESLERRGIAVPWRHVAAIGVQVLAGLAAAHERVDTDGWPASVFHRDVTPQNILLGVNGVAKITDFGLARAMDRVSMTGPDMVKGKLSYLAPELVAGAPASAQSDVYALGIVLWEMLAGERLFWANTPSERVRKVVAAEIPSLRARRQTLPSALVGVVERALARDPARRFESAQAMHDALLLSLGAQLVSAKELAEAVMDARVALGYSRRSLRPVAPSAEVARDLGQE
ncbi:MAG: serine/threonine-protein kinase [Polyangiales bacterium]